MSRPNVLDQGLQKLIDDPQSSTPTFTEASKPPTFELAGSKPPKFELATPHSVGHGLDTEVAGIPNDTDYIGAVKKLAAKYKVQPSTLYAMAKGESSFQANAPPTGSYYGLYQIHKNTLPSLGVTLAQYKAMTRAQQTEVFDKYLQSVDFRPGDGDDQLMGTLPFGARSIRQKDPNHVVWGVGSKEWNANPGWRSHGNGPITVGSAIDYYKRHLVGGKHSGKGSLMSQPSGGGAPPAPPPTGLDPGLQKLIDESTDQSGTSPVNPGTQDVQGDSTLSEPIGGAPDQAWDGKGLDPGLQKLVDSPDSGPKSASGGPMFTPIGAAPETPKPKDLDVYDSQIHMIDGQLDHLNQTLEAIKPKGPNHISQLPNQPVPESAQEKTIKGMIDQLTKAKNRILSAKWHTVIPKAERKAAIGEFPSFAEDSAYTPSKANAEKPAPKGFFEHLNDIMAPAPLDPKGILKTRQAPVKPSLGHSLNIGTPQPQFSRVDPTRFSIDPGKKLGIHPENAAEDPIASSLYPTDEMRSYYAEKSRFDLGNLALQGDEDAIKALGEMGDPHAWIYHSGDRRSIAEKISNFVESGGSMGFSIDPPSPGDITSRISDYLGQKFLGEDPGWFTDNPQYDEMRKNTEMTANLAAFLPLGGEGILAKLGAAKGFLSLADTAPWALKGLHTVGTFMGANFGAGIVSSLAEGRPDKVVNETWDMVNFLDPNIPWWERGMRMFNAIAFAAGGLHAKEALIDRPKLIKQLVDTYGNQGMDTASATKAVDFFDKTLKANRTGPQTIKDFFSFNRIAEGTKAGVDYWAGKAREYRATVREARDIEAGRVAADVKALGPGSPRAEGEVQDFIDHGGDPMALAQAYGPDGESVVRSAILPKNPEHIDDLQAELKKYDRELKGQSGIPEAAESFIAEKWQQHTQALLNAVNTEIENTAGAGRKLGPLKRQLTASLENGEPIQSVREELADKWEELQGQQATPGEAPPVEEPKPPKGRKKRTAAEAMDDFRKAAEEAKNAKSAGVGFGEKGSKYIEAAQYLIEAGVRTLAEFTKHMVDKFGEEIRPHLEKMWEVAKSNADSNAPWRTTKSEWDAAHLQHGTNTPEGGLPPDYINPGIGDFTRDLYSGAGDGTFEEMGGKELAYFKPPGDAKSVLHYAEGSAVNKRTGVPYLLATEVPSDARLVSEDGQQLHTLDGELVGYDVPLGAEPGDVISEDGATVTHAVKVSDFKASGAKTLHEYFVREALKEGKPVPPEVMADYPELRINQSEPSGASAAEGDIKRPHQSDDPLSVNFHEPKQKGETNRSFAQRIQADTRAANGGEPVDYRDPAQRERLSQSLATDAQHEITTNPDNNALGWYDRKVAGAIRLATKKFPTIATNEGHRGAYTYALAVTSNGIRVNDNHGLTDQVFERYLKTGKMPNFGIGKSAENMKAAFKFWNDNVKPGESPVGFLKFLNTDFTVREAKAMGINTGGELSSQMISGAHAIGAKIGGGFLRNLMGHFDSLTSDRWLQRTWGRMTGKLVPESSGAEASLIKKLRDTLPGVSDSEISHHGFTREQLMKDNDALAEFAGSVHDRFASGAPNPDSGLEKSDKTYVDKRPLTGAARQLDKYYSDTLDAPSGQDRAAQRQVVKRTIEILKSHGIDISTADLQALIWYPEQRLWGAGANAVDYEGAAERRYGSLKKPALDTPLTSPGYKLGGIEGSDRLAEQRSRVLGNLRSSLRGYLKGNGDGAPTAYARRGNQGTAKSLLVNGKPLAVKGRFAPSKTWKNAFETVVHSDGSPAIIAPEFLESSDPAQFHRLISDAKASQGEVGQAVHVYDPSEYAEMRTFVTPDGMAGFALKGDATAPEGYDIVSVFNHKSGPRGVAPALIQLATDLGGRRLDAFDMPQTHLQRIYNRIGYKETARLPFPREHAPEGWNYEKNGEPDVVYMAHDTKTPGYVKTDNLVTSPDEGEASQVEALKNHPKIAVLDVQSKPNASLQTSQEQSPASETLRASGGGKAGEVGSSGEGSSSEGEKTPGEGQGQEKEVSLQSLVEGEHLDGPPTTDDLPPKTGKTTGAEDIAEAKRIKEEADAKTKGNRRRSTKDASTNLFSPEEWATARKIGYLYIRGGFKLFAEWAAKMLKHLPDWSMEQLKALHDSLIGPKAFKTGDAIWKSEGSDVPVKVTDYLGQHEGEHYVAIEGSKTGIPMSQITYSEKPESTTDTASRTVNGRLKKAKDGSWSSPDKKPEPQETAGASEETPPTSETPKPEKAPESKPETKATDPLDDWENPYGITHAHNEARAAAGEIAEVPRGVGINTPEALVQARKWIAGGGDPEALMGKLESGKIHIDKLGEAMTIFRVHGEKLFSDRAEAEASGDSEAIAKAKAAEDAWNARIKRLATSGSNILKSLQGETNVDTGDWRQMALRASENSGESFTANSEMAKQYAAKIKAANAQVEHMSKRLDELLKSKSEKASKRDTGKIPTDKKGLRGYFDKLRASGWKTQKMEQAGGIIVGPKLTPKQIAAIWKYAKDAYIDAPSDANADVRGQRTGDMLGGLENPRTLGDIADRVAEDLGFHPDEIKEVFAGKKTAERAVSDQMYRDIAERNRIVRNAKDWMENGGKKTPAQIAQNFVKGLSQFPGTIAVTGHGTVSMFTHAGSLVYAVGRQSPVADGIVTRSDASHWREYFAKQFKVAWNPARHEEMLDSMEKHPMYWSAIRDGVKASRDFQEDYGFFAKVLKRWPKLDKISGQRGMDVLKPLRVSMYANYMSNLPKELVGDPLIGELIAEMVNHATGAAKLPLGLEKYARLTMFAPSLEVSRFASTIGDTLKTVKTRAKVAAQIAPWLGVEDPPLAERYMAGLRAKRAGRLFAVYLGTLVANQVLLSAFGHKESVNFLNPMDTSSWLRYKWGNNTFDTTAGKMNPIGLLWNLATGTYRTIKGEKQPGDDRFSNPSSASKAPVPTLERYGRGKLAPQWGILTDTITGRDARGRPMPWKGEEEGNTNQPTYSYPEYGMTRVTPIPISDVAQQLFEGARDGGLKPIDAARATARLAVAMVGIREGYAKPDQDPDAVAAAIDRVTKWLLRKE